MNIYGMKSNDKLMTFDLIKQQTGANKFFSFTGLEASNQDEVGKNFILEIFFFYLINTFFIKNRILHLLMEIEFYVAI